MLLFLLCLKSEYFLVIFYVWNSRFIGFWWRILFGIFHILNRTLVARFFSRSKQYFIIFSVKDCFKLDCRKYKYQCFSERPNTLTWDLGLDLWLRNLCLKVIKLVACRCLHSLWTKYILLNYTPQSFIHFVFVQIINIQWVNVIFG